MVTEDYVSFETAKLLKEKGFDGECDLFGRTDESELIIREAAKIAYEQGIDDECIILPTLQMAMKWLREVHNIHIEVRVLKPYGTDGHHHSIPKEGVIYYAEILHINKWDKYLEEFEHVGIPTKNTHEQACEAGIKYCLENLI